MKGIRNKDFLSELKDNILKESEGTVREVKVTDHEIEIYINRRDQSPNVDYENIDRSKIYAHRDALFKNDSMLGMYPS